jgi:DNA-binding MarR family transcriptional regulator
VTITEKGEEAYQVSMRRRSVHDVMFALSAEERQQLAISLNKLMEKALEELENFYTSPFSNPR